MLDVIALMLEALGHVVTPVASAAAALGLLADGLGVDLVLTDYHMPGMNGVELAEELRARWPRLPIGLISGTGEGLEVPPDVFGAVLAKPVTIHTLRAALAGLTDTPPHGATEVP